jgi:cell division protein FtsZ
MGVCMQPLFHDSQRRDPVQRQGTAKAQPGNNQEQADQWAVLHHEVQGKQFQRHDEPTRAEWERRDTDENPASSSSSYFGTVDPEYDVDIVVVGVGGGGMNAVNRMINTNVRGVRYVALNTDAQVLALSQASERICLGQHHTKGLGAGGNSAVGLRAATESAAEIRAVLGEADMVFIAAGMGGGTGTGAAPIVASIAKKIGALTIGIVTLPFSFEGTRRRRIADQGLAELSKEVDALITVPNDRLLTTVARDYSLSDAFKVADDVLRQGVQGIAEVINVPGMVNVDFADVRSVLHEAGAALMSIGQGQGRNRAQLAAEEAVAGGFLNVTIRGAKRVLFNISGGEDMTLFEINEVAERIGAAIDDAADITFGAVIDPTLRDTIRVTLIAAGMEEIPTARLQAVRLGHTAARSNSLTGTGQVVQNTPPYQPPAAPAAPKQPSRTAQQQRGTQLPERRQASSTSPRMPSQPNAADQRPMPSRQPAPEQPIRSGQPGQPAPEQRTQRSLNDLRGLRGLGRRQELRRYAGDADDEDIIDVPPFLKRHE